MSGTRDNLNENSKYTVLIAEDEKITREGVEEFLKSKGFNVIAVANGEEVLDHFRDASLVLLDIMMPRLNGIETLRNIRQVSNVPVIMLTALSDEGTQLTTFNELADDYISKPFSPFDFQYRVSISSFEGEGMTSAFIIIPFPPMISFPTSIPAFTAATSPVKVK